MCLIRMCLHAGNDRALTRRQRRWGELARSKYYLALHLMKIFDRVLTKVQHIKGLIGPVSERVHSYAGLFVIRVLTLPCATLKQVHVGFDFEAALSHCGRWLLRRSWDFSFTVRCRLAVRRCHSQCPLSPLFRLLRFDTARHTLKVVLWAELIHRAPWDRVVLLSAEDPLFREGLPNHTFMLLLVAANTVRHMARLPWASKKVRRTRLEAPLLRKQNLDRSRRIIIGIRLTLERPCDARTTVVDGSPLTVRKIWPSLWPRWRVVGSENALLGRHWSLNLRCDHYNSA
ncbi:hypothetical protein TRSC58_03316 [Trypanosoma rangeli SC58]|uniref:Uncharacterized protein n=1 Tax=Trypanosoma rangeli SC58 TaxID=429131 RepID=A0A061J4A9_TRYRA|nr:hypothetical protein TRSC58_03316 [Trypanosoma rangeli SC58]